MKTFEQFKKEVERQIPLKSEITSVGNGDVILNGMDLLYRLNEVEELIKAIAHQNSNSAGMGGNQFYFIGPNYPEESQAFADTELEAAFQFLQDFYL